MKDSHIDPEYNRWKRKYPKFPGVVKCVELLKASNVRGAWIDIICIELTDHAKTHPDEVISVFHKEDNDWIRRILLGCLEDAEVPEALPLFEEVLHSKDESERPYAIRGLKKLNSEEARKILWKENEA